MTSAQTLMKGDGISTLAYIRPITTGIAQRLLDSWGEAPYVVIAEFHRKYIDANRPPECAYEHPDAKLRYLGTDDGDTVDYNAAPRVTA
jgi:hypothetical protein